jgi:hypothetical protein
MTSVIFEKLNQKFVWDGRWIIVAALVTYFSIIAASHFLLGSYVIGWSKLGVQIIPSFVDLNILLCGLDAMREGLDPYTYSCKHIGIYYNYPELWIIFSYLPFLTAKNTVLIGVVQLILFFLLILWFIGKQNFSSGVLYAIFLCSPAFMLAVERGNCDLWMFFLILAGICCYKFPLIHYSFFVFATLLKIYPIGFLVSVPAKGKKQRWILAGILLIAFICYLIFIRENLTRILAITPRPYDIFCFGLDDIPKRMENSLNIPLAISRITWYALLGFALYAITKRARSIPEYCSSKLYEYGFLTGTGIYLVSYFLIQSNFEYRLIFLIPAIPQLINWMNMGNRIHRITLILLGLMTWEHFIDLSIQHVIPFYHYLLINQIITALFTLLVFFQIFILALNKINLMKRLF